jgi:hypothetical protein
MTFRTKLETTGMVCGFAAMMYGAPTLFSNLEMDFERDSHAYYHGFIPAELGSILFSMSFFSFGFLGRKEEEILSSDVPDYLFEEDRYPVESTLTREIGIYEVGSEGINEVRCTFAVRQYWDPQTEQLVEEATIKSIDSLLK